MKPLLFASLMVATIATTTSFVVPVQVTNWPSNLNVTVTNFPQSGNPSLHVTALDIETLNISPGVSTSITTGTISQSNLGVLVLHSGSTQFNFTAGFGFAPLKGYTHVNSVRMSILYTLNSWNTGDAFAAQINGISVGVISEKIYQGAYPMTVSGLLSNNTLIQGSNVIDIGINQGGQSPSQVYLYQVRLTIEYTYFA